VCNERIDAYLELERNITRQLTAKKYLESIGFFYDSMRKVEHLPANFSHETLRLKALDKVDGDCWILRPGCLQMSSDGGLNVSAYVG
jgi:hypothetical protein